MYFNAQCIIPFFSNVDLILNLRMYIKHYVDWCILHCCHILYFVKGGLILQKNFNFVLVPKKISLNFRLRSSNKFANHCPLNFELKVKRQWFCTFVWGWNKIEKCVIVIEIKERHGFFWLGIGINVWCNMLIFWRSHQNRLDEMIKFCFRSLILITFYISKYTLSKFKHVQVHTYL